jgi:WD40 repeat protein
MATAEAETSQDEQGPPGGVVYDGFISYSHAADDLLAPRLQSGLQRFAKPWWKRRALRIFRDEASLSANPRLWSSITTALDQSAWFILLLTPDAAASDWVNKEIDYWLERKDPDRIIPVLTDGMFAWQDGDVSGDAVPPSLLGTFADEPRWVDLRFARTEDQLDLKNPGFLGAIADIASAIRGVPKDELESEEVRQHRRTVRTVAAAGVALLALVLLAGTAAVFAIGQQNRASDLAEQEAAARLEAEAQQEVAESAAAAEAEQRAEADRQADAARSQALAATAIAERDNDPQLSLLLTLAATRLVDDLGPLEAALQESIAADRVTGILPRLWDFTMGALSPDGTTVASVESQGRTVVMVDAATGQVLWETEVSDDQLAGAFWNGGLFFSIDGDSVLVALSPNQAGPNASALAPDTPSTGLYTLDATSGALVDFVPVRCLQRVTPSGGQFTRAGEPLAAEVLTETADGCLRGLTDAVRVGTLDPSGVFTEVTHYPYGDLFVRGVPTISADGSVLASGMVAGATTRVFAVGTGEVVFIEEAAGIFAGLPSVSTLSRDGSRVVVGTQPLYLFDLASGDRLQTFQAHASRAWFSADESIVYATDMGGQVLAFDTASGMELMELHGHGNVPRNVSISLGSEVLLTDAFDDPLRLWDGTTGPRGNFSNLPNPVGNSAEGANSVGGGRFLAFTLFDDTGPLDPRYAVVDLASGELLLEGTAVAAVISADGSFVVEAPAALVDLRLESGATAVIQVDGVRVVDVDTGEVLSVLNNCTWYATELPHPFGVDPGCADPLPTLALAVSADGSVAAAGGLANSVAAWDLSTGEAILYRYGSSHQKELEWLVPVALSADGRYLAGEFFLPDVFDDGPDKIDDVDEIELIDLDTGVTVGSTLVGAETVRLVFAPDGTKLYTVDLLTDTYAFAVPSLDFIAMGQRGQGGTSTDIAISPDGRVLASSSYDDFIRLWDPDDLSIAGEIAVQEAALGVATIDFVDAGLLAVTGPNTDILIHVTDPFGLVRIAIDAVDRGFTTNECDSFGIDPCPTTVDEVRSLYGR